MPVSLAELDMQAVHEHYLNRQRVHEQLRELFEREAVTEYAQLALGITDAAGNYSASEHRLGPRILAGSSERDVFDLAVAIEACPNTNHLPKLIYDHAIQYLKISVGSEMAMMLRPDRHWVGNKRTVWCHLLLKHNMDRSRANAELAAYEDGERESEMNYEVWRDVYLRMEPDILTLGRLGSEAALRQGVTPRELRFMWPDAVATFLFDRFGAPRSRR